MTDTLSHIDLTEAEIARLPAGIRRKVEAAFAPSEKANGAWRLVGAPTGRLAALLDLVLERLGPLATSHAAALQEKNIDRLLEILAEDLPRAEVESALDLDNAALRAEYLAETPVLTGAEVREKSGLRPANRSEPASRWKREGKLFGIRKGGIDLYPAFQFADGEPNPAIRKILDTLPRDMSPWQTALWFASGNGWLDGKAPQECLAQVEDVVQAARRLSDPAIG
ncbi:hypothetical protein [Roseibium aggregatum]|uniref:DUF2384 domain-containing protein n=1 Tax=Roseibium aggregatum TaxID=187304 RepID=A0A939J5L4_9HYPH|nr:hypothetical protein [Roseibium aggregatum]MBN9672375.1 hypothetical protein [Roseibium aggregatum]